MWRDHIASRVQLAEHAEFLTEALGLYPGTPVVDVVLRAARRLRIEDELNGMTVAQGLTTCVYVLNSNPNAIEEADTASAAEAAAWVEAAAAEAVAVPFVEEAADPAVTAESHEAGPTAVSDEVPESESRADGWPMGTALEAAHGPQAALEWLKRDETQDDVRPADWDDVSAYSEAAARAAVSRGGLAWGEEVPQCSAPVKATMAVAEDGTVRLKLWTALESCDESRSALSRSSNFKRVARLSHASIRQRLSREEWAELPLARAEARDPRLDLYLKAEKDEDIVDAMSATLLGWAASYFVGGVAFGTTALF